MATYKYENLKIIVGGVEITGFADGDVIQEHIIDRTFKLPPDRLTDKLTDTLIENQHKTDTEPGPDDRE